MQAGERAHRRTPQAETLTLGRETVYSGVVEPSTPTETLSIFYTLEYNFGQKKVSPRRRCTARFAFPDR